MKSSIFFALALSCSFTTACLDTPVDDELLGDDVSELARAATSDARTDLDGTSTFYQVEPDHRRCAAPACGGVFYSLVNAGVTTCIDGSHAERCYAARADWKHTGLGHAALAEVKSALGTRQLLVRASIGRRRFTTREAFAELRVTEAWLGQGPNEASGPFAKILEIDQRCLAAPCLTYREAKLNSTTTMAIAELSWDVSGATDEQVDAALAELPVNGLIIAGDRYLVTGPAGSASARAVTNFYQRAVDKLGVTGDWRHTAEDGTRYNYTFNPDGTFAAMMQPSCMFAPLPCMVKMALLGGTFATAQGQLQLLYTSEVRNGDRVDFAMAGQAGSMRLTGRDFEQELTLRRVAR